MSSPEDRVLLGEIVGVHGVQGQVRVRTHTGDPLDVTAYGPLTAEPGARKLVLKDLREAKGGVVIAKISGVADRNAAEVTGVERETAQAVVNRFALVDLDRQRIMRAVADHHIGAGVDRRMRDLRHVIEHVLMQAPVTGSDDVIALRL